METNSFGNMEFSGAESRVRLTAIEPNYLGRISETFESNAPAIFGRYSAQGGFASTNGNLALQDRRFESLAKGARQFTAESLALQQNVTPANRVVERRQLSPVNERLLSELLSELQNTGEDQKSDRSTERNVIIQFPALFSKVGDSHSQIQPEPELIARTNRQGDDTDIFAGLATTTEGKGEKGRVEAKAETKIELPREVNTKYSNGKGELRAKRDQDGNLCEFTLTDKDGEMNFHRDELGRWIKTDRFGVESIVNGKFELSRDNELVYKKPNGEMHVHKNDGAISKGRVLADGSTVTLDDSGNKAVVLNRKDGTKVECDYDKDKLSKVVETDETGKHRTTWAKDADGVWHSKSESKEKDGKWTDSGASSGERRNLQLAVDGRYSYEDKLQYKHVLNGDGSERIEPKVTANQDGTKTVEIQYPEGKGFRTLTVDKSNKLIKFTEQDADGKRSYFKDPSGNWHMRAGLKNVSVGGDFQLLKNGDFVSVDRDRYDIQQLDGTVIHEQVNSNGTRLRLNDDNSVSILSRKDGSTVQIGYADGQKRLIVDTNKDETQRTVWVKNDSGTWVSQSQKRDTDGSWASDGKPSEQRKDIDINGQGLTIATDLRGFKHVIGADGSKLNEGPGGSKFTFDASGRIESITYGAGSNRAFKFQYDGNDNLSRVEVYDGNGRLQQTRAKIADGQWRVSKADGTDGGVWQGDMKLSAEGNFMQQDLKDKESGQWQVTTPGFDRYIEKVSYDGRNITRIYPDKAQIDSERTESGEERVRRITRGKESREYRYDSSGKLSEVIDTTAKGTSTWRPEGPAKIYPNGDVAYSRPDGSAVIKKGNFSTVEIDKDGDITRVSTKDGKDRTFEFETVKDKKELVRISDTRTTSEGERREVWNRRRNSDGSVGSQFVSITAGGQERVRDGLEVLQDGDYKYTSPDGKERLAKVGRSDDSGAFSDTVDDARDRLRETMEAHLDQSRRTRLDAFMKQFEKRAGDRVEAMVAAGIDKDKAQQEWEQKLARTYDHLAAMVRGEGAGSPVYDQVTRVKMVENAMYLFMEPSLMNQGNHGTCWIEAGNNSVGCVNHPDAMARMLREVSLNGTFQTTDGQTRTIPKRLLNFDREAQQWTVENAQQPRGTYTRSAVGQVFDHVASWLSDGRMDGGTHGGSPQGCNRALKLITGDSVPVVNISSNQANRWDANRILSAQHRQALLEKGALIVVGPGHMFSQKLVKNNGEWQVVWDNQWGPGNDRVIGKVSDLRNWTVHPTVDSFKPETPGVRVHEDSPVGPVRPNGPDNPNPYNPDDSNPDCPDGDGFRPRQWRPRPWIRFFPRLRRRFGW
jgi:YD repeat-containing protein